MEILRNSNISGITTSLPELKHHYLISHHKDEIRIKEKRGYGYQVTLVESELKKLILLRKCIGLVMINLHEKSLQANKIYSYIVNMSVKEMKNMSSFKFNSILCDRIVNKCVKEDDDMGHEIIVKYANQLYSDIKNNFIIIRNKSFINIEFFFDP